MNKSVKILITIVLAIIILWGIIFGIDYFRCANCKMPIFVRAKETADDGGSGTYYGLGYKVEVKKNISADYGDLLEKVEMYMFDKCIMGAITCIDIYYETSPENDNKYLLNVTPNGTKEIEKITTGELADKYDYDIHYYGLEKVTINIDGNEIDLKQALLNNDITMEQIIEQAENDSTNEIIWSDMYKEGGTMEYHYGTYTIIKSHSTSGNRDVYIGIPEMRLNQISY